MLLLFVALIGIGAQARARLQQRDRNTCYCVGSYPVVTEPVSLTFLTMQPVYIEISIPTGFAKHWSDKTGCHRQMGNNPSRCGKGKTPIYILASGDYPDVFFGLGNQEQGIESPRRWTYGVQEQMFLP